jgi:hypothetical protein
MNIRIWYRNAILADLDIDQKGFHTFVTRPDHPRNDTGHPDIEIDPWAKLIRVYPSDVETFGDNAS